MARGKKGTGPYGIRPDGTIPRQRKPAKLAAAGVALAAAAAIAQPAVDIDDLVRPDRPLGSVDVDTLSGEALKRYARRAGVWHADIDTLTEDRLRQNTKLKIAEHFDLLSEG